MVQWLLPATGQRLAPLVALAVLTACASNPGARQAEAAPDGWRVVERVGEARYLPLGDGAWRATITGRPISEGSEVTTGRGGRLIIARPGRHISVGPVSRFVLPHPEWDHRLEQRAGWLRYRVEAADAAPFRVHTRSLDIEFTAAVLDVRVDDGAVNVTVAEGKVRLATPDGLRRTEIATGQSAQASGAGGARLAVRSAPDEALEAIEPLIIPAVQPTPAATVPPQGARPANGPGQVDMGLAPPDGAAAVSKAPRDPEAAGLGPTGRVPEKNEGPPPVRLADPPPVRAAPAGSGTPAASVPPVPGFAATASARAAAPAAPQTGRRGQFQRLSEGMVDGVRPRLPGRSDPPIAGGPVR
jgi:hypothetical protein